MKYLRILVILLVIATAVCSVEAVKAQCAVCSTNVETNAKNGGIQGNGLNKGVMYLLAAPYLAVAVLGFIWYKKYRRKDVNINMGSEKLNLN
ncbi:hypothetical protein BDD43_1581 [Mucilaginibacter gracilis]|uniref:Uncharacterized protein n=1 Tax=Mucilaginibacter gracilis TaxID=423350 RepID=A0A495IZI8_9SPHI|nr:hypothetical protein [Mucilaginibacter gracilis]RKR81434.1 hypothetical protein BDD43_1581 [Mucilaginibacter gracilis]